MATGPRTTPVEDWQDVPPVKPVVQQSAAPTDWQDVNDWKDTPPAKERGLLGELWEGAKGVGRGIASIPQGVAELSKLSPFSSEGNQLGKAKEMFVDPVLRQHEKAAQDFSSGNTMSGLTRATVGSIPGAGPALLEQSEEIQDPETRSGAIGEVVGAAIAPKVYGLAGRGVSRGVQGVTGAAERVAGAAEEAGTWNPKTVIKTALERVDDPKGTLIRGVKPASRSFNFDKSLDRSMPEMKLSEREMGKPIASVQAAYDAVLHAKDRVWKQYEAAAGPARQIGSTLDLSPVADAMERSLSDKFRMENPAAAARIDSIANRYRGAFSLRDAENLLKTTNSELDAYYAKYPSGQRQALSANPQAAYREAQASTLRDAIYNKLNDAAEGNVNARELKQRYGSLMEMERQLERRKNVANRQQPDSLSEQAGRWSGYGDIARGTVRLMKDPLGGAQDIASGAVKRQAAKYIKEQQTADALIRRAFASYKGEPGAIEAPTTPSVRGLLERGPVQMGPIPDQSSVRGVQAQPAETEWPRLGAGRNVTEMGPIPDMSGDRSWTGPTPPPPPFRQLPAGPQAPVQRQGSGAMPVQPITDKSMVRSLNAEPVIDPETGDILYYKGMARGGVVAPPNMQRSKSPHKIPNMFQSTRR